MSLIDYLVGLVAPHECVNCSVEGSVLCGNCTALLQMPPSRCFRCQAQSESYQTCSGCRRTSLLRAVAVTTMYGELAKAAIHKYKFERAQAAAQPIAKAIVLRHSDFLQGAVLVPVPTATSRVRQRGYDQSVLLAKSLSKQAQCQHASLLRRTGQSQQVGATGKERRTRLAGAFQVVNSKIVPDKRYVLVDDVLTTGATLEAAALTLRKAGARHVEAVVFAQAGPR